MSAFLERYGIAIFTIVIMFVMILMASPLGLMVENVLHNEVNKFTNTTVDDYENNVKEDLGPGLYKPDGTFISWEKLTSKEYCTITNNCCVDQSILVVDENGVLTSGYTTHCYSNLSKEYLEGKLVVSDEVTNIDDYGFYDCSYLTSVILPDTVTKIGNYAFLLCEDLTTVTIPNTMTSIGEQSFYACSSLVSINIPKDVTYVGERAFAGCTNLKSIVVDENNTTYDSRNNCNAIIKTSTNTLITGCQNTIIPDGIVSIGNYSFAFCSSLTAIEIPKDVKNINSFAFIGTSLTSITIPNNVTNISEDIFLYSNSLTTIYYSGIATGAPWGAPNATVLAN